MTDLYTTLQSDRIAAMKASKLDASQKVKYTLLGVILGDVKNAQENSTNAPSDSDVLKVIKKMHNSLCETLALQADFDKSKYLLEEVIINEYVKKYTPTLMSSEQIISIIEACFTKPVRIPDVQKYFKANYAGQYDGAVINKVVMLFNAWFYIH